MNTKNQNLQALCQSAILLALSIVLGFITVYKMPMGGSVTLVSMLPVLLVGVKYGWKWGLGTAFVFSLYQLIQGIAGGDVFVYCTTISTVVICVLFDYLVPFTVLGCSAVVCTKKETVHRTKILVVFGILVFIRFLCHFITGVVIWGQWAPEGMSKGLYSLIYNGQYMLPELIFTVIVAALLMAATPIQKFLNISK